jgi:TM2 domain-containing membrane protein YozV
MPAIIDSAPDCINHNEKYSADDIADFILQDNYKDCAGFMTFGPGSTYGDGGVGATGAYMTLTWIGIVVMVIVFIGWVWYENRRLTTFAETGFVQAGPTDAVPPSPGQT